MAGFYLSEPLKYNKKGDLDGRIATLLDAATTECHEITKTWQRVVGNTYVGQTEMKDLADRLFCVSSAIQALEAKKREAAVTEIPLDAERVEAQLQYLKEFEAMSRLKMTTMGLDPETGEQASSTLVQWIKWVCRFFDLFSSKDDWKMEYLRDLLNDSLESKTDSEAKFEFLLQRDYVRTNVPGDGNCFFNALAADLFPGSTETQIKVLARKYRKDFAQAVRENADEIDDNLDILLRNPRARHGRDVADLSVSHHGTPSDYIKARLFADIAERNGVWMDYDTALLMSLYVLKRPIHIISFEHNDVERGKLVASEHTRFGQKEFPREKPLYLYLKGDHYQSLQRKT